MTAGEGFIWVSNRFDHTVSRINEVTRARATIKLGGQPAGLLANGSTIWATITSSYPL
jgi:hypothetical protein